jgi:DNA-binding GntR family transcriptional regulator
MKRNVKDRGRSPMSVSRNEYAYSEIRRQILDGHFVADEPLSEYHLAASLKISRTPIREALKRLEHDGLVRFVVNHGAFVRGLSSSDIVEIYQVREQLEGFAAYFAATNMPDDEIAALEEELARAARYAAQKRIVETFESDVDLHRHLIACTQNERLAKILDSLSDQVHRIRVLSPNSPGRLEATLEEHQEILSRIKKRDNEGARTAMTQHLRNAQQNAIRLLMTPAARQRVG